MEEDPEPQVDLMARRRAERRRRKILGEKDQRISRILTGQRETETKKSLLELQPNGETVLSPPPGFGPIPLEAVPSMALLNTLTCKSSLETNENHDEQKLSFRGSRGSGDSLGEKLPAGREAEDGSSSSPSPSPGPSPSPRGCVQSPKVDEYHEEQEEEDECHDYHRKEQSFPRKVSLISTPIDFKRVQQSQQQKQGTLVLMFSALLWWASAHINSIASTLVLVLVAVVGSAFGLNFVLPFILTQTVRLALYQYNGSPSAPLTVNYVSLSFAIISHLTVFLFLYVIVQVLASN